MTINEAITHEKELAKEIYVEAMLCHANPDDGKLDSCIESGKYHEQLAEWLEDYKHIKQWKSDVMDDFCRYDVNSFEELAANARNKAIDECIKIVKFHRDSWDCIEWAIRDIEELKACVDNEYGNIVDLVELENKIRSKAIDDFVRLANTMPTVEEEDGEIRPMWLEEMAEQLKEGDGE